MRRRIIPLTVVALLIGGILTLVVWRLLQAPATEPEDGEAMAAPVEVAAVERGPIEERRTFSGTLEPRAEFIVAPKVSGRVDVLRVDIGDPVVPGGIIAELDDDEFVQAVAQAQAEVEVARANVAEARSALDAARREYERIQTLQQRNIASESALDAAEADLRAREAQLAVAEAQVQREAAALASTRVRLSYTQVTASWPGEDGPRTVAERYVDEGATVAANDPIVTVVDLSTVRAVMFVTEGDYGRLEVGQPAMIRTDAYPGEIFAGRILRLAPVFEEASRQARVEVDIPNPDGRLKPGMFVRVTIVLDTAEEATIVPAAALVRRQDREGVFAVDETGERVRFVPVRVGIQGPGRVQVFADGLSGRVVTLGQHLVEDGSPIRTPQPVTASGEAATP